LKEAKTNKYYKRH